MVVRRHSTVHNDQRALRPGAGAYVLEARFASRSSDRLRRIGDRWRSIAAVFLGSLAGLALAVLSAEGVRQRSEPSFNAASKVAGSAEEVSRPLALRSAKLDALTARLSDRALTRLRPGAVSKGERSTARFAGPSVSGAAAGPPVQAAIRFAPKPAPKSPPRSDRAKISLIIDDLGLNPVAFERVMAVPALMTLAFLPYGDNLQQKADAARAAGHSVLLHLPMEPFGAADPGPGALTASMSADVLRAKTIENLGRFKGYTGVNNHMGSRLTADGDAMTVVLLTLQEEGVFFLDSVTSAKTVASKTSQSLGLKTYKRDVFLDAAPGRKGLVDGFAALEAIAVKRGYAIGIIHPRTESLEALTQWTTTAAARGFDLVTVEDLPALDEGSTRVAAVAIRQAG